MFQLQLPFWLTAFPLGCILPARLPRKQTISLINGITTIVSVLRRLFPNDRFLVCASPGPVSATLAPKSIAQRRCTPRLQTLIDSSKLSQRKPGQSMNSRDAHTHILRPISTLSSWQTQASTCTHTYTDTNTHPAPAPALILRPRPASRAMGVVESAVMHPDRTLQMWGHQPI